MATPLPPSQTPSPCARGLTGADLSAYRDGMPMRGVGHHAGDLDAHIADCPACHARLEQLDQLADTLRAERVPEPDERLWQAVRRAEEAAPARRVGMRWPLGTGQRGSLSHGKRPLLGGLCALAAVLLLLLGFAQLFALHNASQRVTHAPTPTVMRFPTLNPLPTVTLTPTPTLLPAHPLTWRAAVLPTAASEFNEGSIVPAGDGQTAYACAVATSANSGLLIWTTHDQGQTWSPAQVIPPAPDVNGCELVVDASDPSVAALCGTPRGGGAGDSCSGWMTTVDGGVTWQALPYQPFMRYDQLDSRGGVIYALRETASADGSSAYHLWASRDRMGSWQQVDHGLTADLAGFWLQPDGPGILAVLSDGADSDTNQMWASPDDGATWHQLSVPGGLPFYTPVRFASAGASSNGIVARWLNGHFSICVASFGHVTCSTDGGVTWQVRTMISLPTQQGFSVGANLVAITNDGTLLAAGLGTLYRLAASSDLWQSLGPLPQFAVTYCLAPGEGALWAIASTVGAPVDPQHRIFTAAYTS